jgi:branched-subunit amino acid ABC-type transport system permease component
MISESAVAYLLQQVLNAAPVAALYAMLAFGYGLSFRLTRRVEFTAGALFAFAGQILVLFTAFGYDAFRLVYPAALTRGRWRRWSMGCWRRPSWAAGSSGHCRRHHPMQ